MVEIGTREAEGPSPFDSKQAPLPEFTPAFCTCRVTDDPEDDDVAGITTDLTTARRAGVSCTLHVGSICNCLLDRMTSAP
jgi:hypothetical protein